jgi:hypothetical protein
MGRDKLPVWWGKTAPFWCFCELASRLKLLAWPDLPVAEKTSAEISVVAHALTAIGELFKPASPVAAKPVQGHDVR